MGRVKRGHSKIIPKMEVAPTGVNVVYLNANVRTSDRKGCAKKQYHPLLSPAIFNSISYLADAYPPVLSKVESINGSAILVRG